MILMAKFKMECNRCGQPIEVRTGLFVNKKKYFTCECGFSTRAIKKVEEKCPSCDDYFVYDRSKDISPACPHCHSVLDREMRFKKAIEIEAEKRKQGIGVERSPYYTVDLTKLFNNDSQEDTATTEE